MNKLTALFAITTLAATAGIAQARDLGPDEALKLRDAGTIQSFDKLNAAALAKHPGATITETEDLDKVLAFDGKELARYDLSEDASVETAMIFGEIYRNNGDWKFKAIGQGFQGGLGPLAKNFGVSV